MFQQTRDLLNWVWAVLFIPQQGPSNFIFTVKLLSWSYLMDENVMPSLRE